MLDPVAVTKSPFQLRGSLFTLSAMQLYSCSLDDIARELKMVIRQAPKFFEQAPIVLDLQQLDPNAVPDFAALTQLIRDHGLIPVGIRNANAEQLSAAKAQNLAVLSNAKTEEPQLSTKQKPVTETPKTTKPQAKTDTKAAAKNILMTKPVRSGQQVYAQGGDLVVVGAVSAGAECIADGNIHIYGPLRGRALAGASGDTSARIFCHSMEAELVSVAGCYMVNETLKQQTDNIPQQIFLKDGKLTIEKV